MYKQIVIILFLFTLINATKAQDPNFSQYYVNGIYINPAMNASKGSSKASTQYRSQWAGKSYRFSTYNAALEVAFNNSNSSIGFMAVSDETRSNLLHHSAFSFVYAYKFQLNRRWFIQSAVQAGIGQNQLSNDLVFEDQLSLEGPTASRSAERFADENMIYPDFSTGFTFFSQEYYFGAAIHHLNRPNLAFRSTYERNLERKYTFQGGAKFSKNLPGRKETYYSPNFIVQFQGKSSVISLGNYFYHDGFTAGLWYRWNDALTAGVGYEFTNFRINYSTDFSVGKYPSNSLSHEVSLAIRLQSTSRRKNRFNDGLVYCPSF
jgi:type IX secretion system PorP/SprF family membrane protein